LDTWYVWYGFGSTAQERQAALEYAQGLKTTGASVIELTEGENDDDEMFWMVLGDDEFANADYWKWRRMATRVDPNIWRIDTSHNKDPVSSGIKFQPASVDMLFCEGSPCQIVFGRKSSSCSCVYP
jgi:hypothetical protein